MLVVGQFEFALSLAGEHVVRDDDLARDDPLGPDEKRAAPD